MPIRAIYRIPSGVIPFKNACALIKGGENCALLVERGIYFSVGNKIISSKVVPLDGTYFFRFLCCFLDSGTNFKCVEEGRT